MTLPTGVLTREEDAMSQWPYLTNAFASILDSHGNAGKRLREFLTLVFEQHQTPSHASATALNEATERLLAATAAAAPDTLVRRFTMYRRGDLSATHDANQVNRPEDAQFEGVVFTDGTVALRWRTPLKSTSVWQSLDAALGVHGHFDPRYQSEIVWHDAARASSDAGVSL